ARVASFHGGSYGWVDQHHWSFHARGYGNAKTRPMGEPDRDHPRRGRTVPDSRRLFRAVESVHAARDRGRRLSRTRGSSTAGVLGRRPVRLRPWLEPDMTSRPTRVAGAIMLTSISVWLSPIATAV